MMDMFWWLICRPRSGAAVFVFFVIEDEDLPLRRGGFPGVDRMAHGDARRGRERFVRQSGVEAVDAAARMELLPVGAEHMIKRQREHGLHIPGQRLYAQRLGEEKPCTGVPVVAGEQQPALGDIDHRAARRMPGAGNDPGSHAAQAEIPLGRGLRRGIRRREEIRRGRDAGLRGLLRDAGAALGRGVAGVERDIGRAKQHGGKIARAERMIVMRMGEQHGQRLIRDRADEGGGVIKAVARVDEQRALASGEQGHIHAQRIADMEDAGQRLFEREHHLASCVVARSGGEGGEGGEKERGRTGKNSEKTGIELPRLIRRMDVISFSSEGEAQYLSSQKQLIYCRLFFARAIMNKTS